MILSQFKFLKRKKKGSKEKRRKRTKNKRKYTTMYIYLIRIISSIQLRVERERQPEMAFKNYQNLFKSCITWTKKKQLGLFKAGGILLTEGYNLLLEIVEERVSKSPPHPLGVWESCNRRPVPFLTLSIYKILEKSLNESIKTNNHK